VPRDSTRTALRLLSYGALVDDRVSGRALQLRLRLCWQVRARHLCLNIIICQYTFVASISILVADVPINRHRGPPNLASACAAVRWTRALLSSASFRHYHTWIARTNLPRPSAHYPSVCGRNRSMESGGAFASRGRLYHMFHPHRGPAPAASVDEGPNGHNYRAIQPPGIRRHPGVAKTRRVAPITIA